MKLVIAPALGRRRTAKGKRYNCGKTTGSGDKEGGDKEGERTTKGLEERKQGTQFRGEQLCSQPHKDEMNGPRKRGNGREKP